MVWDEPISQVQMLCEKELSGPTYSFSKFVKKVWQDLSKRISTSQERIKIQAYNERFKASPQQTWTRYTGSDPGHM